MGKIVTLDNVGLDKYGRLLAEVIIDGENLSDLLLDEGLAVSYDGGKRRFVKWRTLRNRYRKKCREGAAAAS